jgi:hypothetical protein
VAVLAGGGLASNELLTAFVSDTASIKMRRAAQLGHANEIKSLLAERRRADPGAATYPPCSRPCIPPG